MVRIPYPQTFQNISKFLLEILLTNLKLSLKIYMAECKLDGESKK